MQCQDATNASIKLQDRGREPTRIEYASYCLAIRATTHDAGVRSCVVAACACLRIEPSCLACGMADMQGIYRSSLPLVLEENRCDKQP